jgi:hypothetical protein
MEVAMRTVAVSRRRFLLSSAILGAAGMAAGASSALAFSVEQMDVKTEAVWLSACQAPGSINPYHRQLLADVMAALQGKPKTEIDAQVATLTCPLCGCHVT